MTLTYVPNLKRDRFRIQSESSSNTNCMEKVGNINFLVGPNNSGKSRFLRKLLQSEFVILGQEQETLFHGVVRIQQEVLERYQMLDDAPGSSKFIIDQISIKERLEKELQPIVNT